MLEATYFCLFEKGKGKQTEKVFLVKYHLLLSELLSPKGRSVKASPQAKRYFNPDSQAALWCMLSEWARVRRSTVGHCKQHGSGVKKHR